MEQLITKLKNYKSECYLFIFSLCVGLCTHMFMLTNKFLVHDSMFTFYESRVSTVLLGRFLQPIFAGLSSYYDLPWVNGLFSLIYAAFIVNFIVKIFEINKISNKCLISLFFMTYPAFTATLSFMHIVDCYLLAILFIVISVYLVEKRKKVILSSILLMTGIAIYQSYISFAILLCLFLLIKKVIDNININDLKTTILRYLSYGILGLGLYFILMKLSLFLTGATLKTYQGVDAIGQISLSELPFNILRSYWHIIKYIFIYKYSNPNIFTTICYLFVFGIAFYILVKILVNKKITNVNKFILVFLVILIPIVTNIFSIVASSSEVHTLMTYQYVLLFIFIIYLVENYVIKHKLIIVFEVCMLIISYDYFLIDNIAYNNLQQKYEKSYSISLMIADRIQNLKEFSPEMEICFVGQLDHNKYITYNLGDKTLYPMTGVVRSNLLDTPFHIKQFISYFIGLDYQIVDENIREVYTDNSNVKEMPIWPASDSVKIIDNIVVVKLSDF